MAKVTEQDVIHFLKEKVARITRELETAQSALKALQEASGPEAPSEGQKPGAAAGGISISKSKAKPSGARRGRKPGDKKIPSETIRVADQLG